MLGHFRQSERVFSYMEMQARNRSPEDAKEPRAALVSEAEKSVDTNHFERPKFISAPRETRNTGGHMFV